MDGLRAQTPTTASTDIAGPPSGTDRSIPPQRAHPPGFRAHFHARSVPPMHRDLMPHVPSAAGSMYRRSCRHIGRYESKGSRRRRMPSPILQRGSKQPDDGAGTRHVRPSLHGKIGRPQVLRERGPGRRPDQRHPTDARYTVVSRMPSNPRRAFTRSS